MEKKDFFYQIANPVLYDTQSPYKLMTKKLNDIDIDYFQGSVPLGKTVSKEIEIDIKHRILNDFISHGKALMDSCAKEIEKEIVDNVRASMRRYPDKAEALRDLNDTFKYMHQFVRKQLCFAPNPMYSDDELRDLYEAAKRVTFYERLTGTNDRDVLEYYHALIGHTVWACRMLMRRKASQFLMQMVDVLSREFDMNSPWATSYNDAPSAQQNPKLPKELLPLAEKMAEHEHNAWMQTRVEQGWTYGTVRDDAAKKHPCLVPYADLPEEEKVSDRNASLETLRFILAAGFRIERK